MHNKFYIAVFFLVFITSSCSMHNKPCAFPNGAHQQLAIRAMQSAREKCREQTTNRKSTDEFKAAEQQYVQAAQRVKQTNAAILDNQIVFSEFQILDSEFAKAIENGDHKNITPAFTNRYQAALTKVNEKHKEVAAQLHTFSKPIMVDAETQTEPEPVEIKEEPTNKTIGTKYFSISSIESPSSIVIKEADQEALKTNDPAIKSAIVTSTPKQKNKKVKKHKKISAATRSSISKEPALAASMKSAEVSLIQASKNLLEISLTSQKLMQNMLDEKRQALDALKHPHSDDKSRQKTALEHIQPQLTATSQQTVLRATLKKDLEQKLQTVIGDSTEISGKQFSQLVTTYPDLFNKEFLQKQMVAYDKKSVLKKKLSFNTRAGQKKS